MTVKRAKTIDEQLEILESRGMILDEGRQKAEEYLRDIGYYRLGFYSFPFEINPSCKNRDHHYKEGTKLSDVVKLYYLDDDLRTLLWKYINRIEVNFRTSLVHTVSMIYVDKTTWFADSLVMHRDYIAEFDSKVYNKNFRKISVIRNHHQKYINDRYAPAWKTMEYFTFGQMLRTFRALKNPLVKKEIASIYNLSAIKTLDNYINTIVRVRNVCAHGDVLYDLNLPLSITQKGPITEIEQANRHKLISSILVIQYMLKIISENRANDMNKKINDLFNQFKNHVEIRHIIENNIGYEFD